MRGKYAESTRYADAYSPRILRAFSAYSPRILRAFSAQSARAENARRMRGEYAENTRRMRVSTRDFPQAPERSVSVAITNVNNLEIIIQSGHWKRSAGWFSKSLQTANHFLSEQSVECA